MRSSLSNGCGCGGPKPALAEDPLRIALQDELKRETHEKDPHVRRLERPLRWQPRGDYFRRGPDSPDQERAQDRPPVVGAAPDDEHHPDEERGGHRLGHVGVDELDVMGHECAAEAHHRPAEDERLDAELLDVLPRRAGRRLVLANGGHDPSPRGPPRPLEEAVEREHDREHQQQHRDLVPGLRKVLERLRDEGHAARSVGRPGLVLEHEPQDLGDSEGRDGEVVAAKADADPGYPPRDEGARDHRGHQPRRGRKPESTEMAFAGGGGQERAGVGADREESGDPRVEQAGEPPLDVEPEGEHRVDPAHREQKHRVEKDAVELLHQNPSGATICVLDPGLGLARGLFGERGLPARGRPEARHGSRGQRARAPGIGVRAIRTPGPGTARSAAR